MKPLFLRGGTLWRGGSGWCQLGFSPVPCGCPAWSCNPPGRAMFNKNWVEPTDVAWTNNIEKNWWDKLLFGMYKQLIFWAKTGYRIGIEPTDTKGFLCMLGEMAQLFALFQMPKATLLPIIMVPWKMGVSPILVSFHLGWFCPQLLLMVQKSG